MAAQKNGILLSFFGSVRFTVECKPQNIFCTSELYKLCHEKGMKPYKSSKYSFDIQTVDGDQAEFEQVLSPWLSSKGLIASQNEYFGYTFYDTSQPITPFPQEFTLCLGEWQNQSSDVT